MAVERFVEALEEGVYVGNYVLKIYHRSKGRFVEEENVCVKWGGDHIFYAKVFKGRGAYYKPWVEIFKVNRGFFGSPVELFIYKLIYENIPRGGRIFVEYWEDRETLNFLAKGGDPKESRMGKVLMEAGFKGLRDWYIPEGLKEGFYKLQAEKL